MLGLSLAACATLGMQEVAFFRPFTFLEQGEQPAITKGLFSGPNKVRKIGDVTAGPPQFKIRRRRCWLHENRFRTHGPATLQHICAREGAKNGPARRNHF